LQRIGLFGGTFNPIHKGHLRIADEIREHFSLDCIIFIPTGIPPHKEKSEIIDQVHRMEMVKLAIADYKNFTLSSIEIERKGISYSVDTIKTLQKEMGSAVEFYFIVGIDAFLEIRTWKNVDELLTLCNFVVITRPGHRFADLEKAGIPCLKGVTSADLERLDRRDISRLSIPLTEHYSLFLEQITPCNISSTELRRFIKEGKEVKNLLPLSVLSYIIENRLYR